MTRMKRLERAQTRLGAYSLLRPLSASDVARDFLAHVDDDGSGAARYRVVRIVSTALSAHQGFGTAFEDAVTRAMEIDHPNLIRVVDYGAQNGEYYLATEYTPGTFLSSLQQRLQEESKQLPAPCVMAIGLSLASALHWLHAGVENGPLLHGDVTMERVFINVSGEIKLGDFCVEHAIRALAGPAASAAARERTKTPHGIARVAVEQLLNDRVDVRADQYAIGALMFELLAGLPAFERADLASTVAAVLGAPRPDLRTLAHVPDELAAIVDRTLARRPDERYPTPAALYAELEHVAQSYDVMSAIGLLSGLARGLQPPLEPAPESDVIQLTEAMVEPIPETPAPGVAPLDGDHSSVDHLRAPVTDLDAVLVDEMSPPASEASGEGVGTIVWIALVTAAVVASIFLWAWVLGQ